MIQTEGRAYPLPALLAAVDNALRNGSYMTNANLAFEYLCDHLGVDRNSLIFDRQWSLHPLESAQRPAEGGPEGEGARPTAFVVRKHTSAGIEDSKPMADRRQAEWCAQQLNATYATRGTYGGRAEVVALDGGQPATEETP